MPPLNLVLCEISHCFQITSRPTNRHPTPPIRHQIKAIAVIPNVTHFHHRIHARVVFFIRLLTQPLGYLRVMHLRIILRYFATLQSRPDHERVHRSLNVLLVLSLRCVLYHQTEEDVAVVAKDI